MLFTTSWDDGHPFDLRLAEMLNCHGFRGTFYVPMTNREGLPVLGVSDLRRLDSMGEVGSHTLDHCYLTTVERVIAWQQIHDGRTALEDALGHPVKGFCYPGGKFRPEHRAMVESDGFEYARTIKNLVVRPGMNPFELPTTLQLFPHSPVVYLRNWVRHGQWWQRAPLAAKACATPDLLSLLKISLLHAKKMGGLFHLWGHSWELDGFGGWAILDSFLAFAANHVEPSERVTNNQTLGMKGLP